MGRETKTFVIPFSGFDETVHGKRIREEVARYYTDHGWFFDKNQPGMIYDQSPQEK